MMQFLDERGAFHHLEHVVRVVRSGAVCAERNGGTGHTPDARIMFASGLCTMLEACRVSTSMSGSFTQMQWAKMTSRSSRPAETPRPSVFVPYASLASVISSLTSARCVWTFQ